MHMCGSIMLPSSTNPLNELVFFLIQPPGILCLGLVNKALRRKTKDSLSRYALNAMGCYLWLHLTLPLLMDDQIHGGF